MSVPKHKRGKSKLEVVTKAIELADYTIRICSNEKNFPKRHRWSITGKIVDDSIAIHDYVRKANSIYVKMESDFKTRRQYQNQAIATIDAMLGKMDIAYKMFKIDDNRIEHWTGIIIEVRKLLRGWRKSDYRKYKEKFMG